uniref:Uncharacterized protein n=1 Tax=Rhodnius prolixus TaxID=13249 RepID=T1I7U0_RHOPR
MPAIGSEHSGRGQMKIPDFALCVIWVLKSVLSTSLPCALCPEGIQEQYDFESDTDSTIDIVEQPPDLLDIVSDVEEIDENELVHCQSKDVPEILELHSNNFSVEFSFMKPDTVSYIPPNQIKDVQIVRYYGHHFLNQFIRGKPIRFGFN